MSKNIAVAFQSLNKTLVHETRIKTLDLYRSLLRSSEKCPHKEELKTVIREKFKQNKFIPSRGKVLDLLEQADRARKVLQDDKACAARINAYFAQHKQKPKWGDTASEKSKKKKKEVKRKPYQVAITTQQSCGYEFKRVRGWRQPVRTAMMLKNRVKVNQLRIDRFYKFRSQLEMIRSERLFLKILGCLPGDKLMGFENTIQQALNINGQYDAMRKSRQDIANDE